MGGVLAIDLGTKKTGFAATDALRISRQPLDGIQAGEAAPELLEHLARLLEERDVSTLLIGLPRNMDGSEGERALGTRAFAERVRARFPRVEVVLYDERLTTKAADALLTEAGHRGEAAKKRRDSWSALVLLGDWLDSGEPRS